MASISSTMLRGLVKNKMERVNREIKEAKTNEDKVKAYRQGLSIPVGAIVLGKYNITETELGGVPATWISQDFFSQDKVILYLHGGGYIGGSVLYSRNGAASLAVAASCLLVGLEYRLAPEHPWPAALDDAIAAYKQLLDDGFAAECISIVGESAGGGLSLALTLALKDQGIPLPSSVVALSPWCDLAMTNIMLRANRERDILLDPEFLQLAANLYAQNNDRTNPYISPLYGNFSNFPPLLMQVAAEEVLLGEIIKTADLAEKQSENKVIIEIYEGMWHVWQTMDEIVPEAHQAVVKIGEFVRGNWPEPSVAKKDNEGLSE